MTFAKNSAATVAVFSFFALTQIALASSPIVPAPIPTKPTVVAQSPIVPAPIPTKPTVVA